MKDVEQFMELVDLFRQWFKEEEIEVSDFVLGRMAARLRDYLDSQSDTQNKDSMDRRQEVSEQEPPVHWIADPNKRVKDVPPRRAKPPAERWHLIDVTLWIPATSEDNAFKEANRFVDSLSLPRRWNAVVNELTSWDGGLVEEPVEEEGGK